MGQLVDDNEEVVTLEAGEGELSDIADEQPQTQRQQTKAHQDEPDELPEKYRGKSVKEIVKMHEEAEKLIGRQGSDLGELRKLADKFILKELEQKAPKVEDTIDEVDFFADPKAAVKKAIESSPEVQAAKAAALNMRKAETYATLERKYPGFMENTVQDPEFQKWVMDSKVRVELFSRADQAFDVDAAEELLSTWNERKARTESIKQTAAQETNRQVKAASTGVVGNSGEASSRKVYRRADIIKLIQTDPDRYEALQPELMKAYAEGRVR